MITIAPGNSPQFVVTPIWSGAPGVTILSKTTWTSSDPDNFPVTANASDNTGLSATVNIPQGATLGEAVTLTWEYTNPDGSTATAIGNFVDGVIVPSNVTGGTMAQSE